MLLLSTRMSIESITAFKKKVVLSPSLHTYRPNNGLIAHRVLTYEIISGSPKVLINVYLV